MTREACRFAVMDCEYERFLVEYANRAKIFHERVQAVPFLDTYRKRMERRIKGRERRHS
jgi:hypothetical protein